MGNSTNPHKYLFYTQCDSECHAAPFINLSLLRGHGDSLQDSNSLQSIPADSWHTKEEWLNLEFAQMRSWQQAIARATAKDGAFAEYQRKIETEGIIGGHIWKKNPRFAPTTAERRRCDKAVWWNPKTWSPLTLAKETLLRPFNFADLRAMGDPGNVGVFKTTPLFLDDEGKVFCFNPVTKLHEEVSKGDYNDKVAFYDRSSGDWIYIKLSAEQKSFLGIPQDEHFFFNVYDNKVYGKKRLSHLYLPAESAEKAYYMQGLCQFMLFAMGVDKENKDITPDHELYDAYKDLRAELAREENPWKAECFKKENFFEYQLAKLFQTNPVLKDKAKRTLGIFLPTWDFYQETESLTDDAGNPLSKKHLMGEDQYLAYSFSQTLRFLWGAAKSKQAFSGLLGLDDFGPKTGTALKTLINLPGVTGPNQVLRNAERNVQGDSFLSVWQEILAELKIGQPDGAPDTMVSFSSHGFVMDFRSDMMPVKHARQTARRTDIMEKLGFGVVESLYEKGLEPWYRRGSEISTPAATLRAEDTSSICSESTHLLANSARPQRPKPCSGPLTWLRNRFTTRQTTNQTVTAASRPCLQ